MSAGHRTMEGTTPEIGAHCPLLRSVAPEVAELLPGLRPLIALTLLLQRRLKGTNQLPDLILVEHRLGVAIRPLGNGDAHLVLPWTYHHHAPALRGHEPNHVL
ncbi:hypothetical protein EON82_19005 [bacterium]|nr:MAG: hypothetical protein EON82_19005 [bacterium]